MEEKVIKAGTEIEEYFMGLPFTTKERIHRYRVIDELKIDEYGRATLPKQEDKRMGKIINNLCYKHHGYDSWELIATKLPDGSIITSSKDIAIKLLKLPKKVTDEAIKRKAKDSKIIQFVSTGDDWENEKHLEKVDRYARDEKIKGVYDYKVLLQI